MSRGERESFGDHISHTPVLNVVIFQMDLVHKDPGANHDKVREFCDRLSVFPQKPDIIILPETWTTGFSRSVFSEISSLAETEGGPSVGLLKHIAEATSSYVIGGSILEMESGRFYNTSFVISPDSRIIGKYRKIQLFTPFEEHKTLSHGEDLPVFQLPFAKIGIMTCYDLRFPEICRIYALKGAQIVFVPSNFPKPRLDPWVTLSKARALENQLFIVAVNRVGATREADYFGHSLVVGPRGDVLTEAGEDEVILSAEIDLGEIQRFREEIPIYSDRRHRVFASAWTDVSFRSE
jgi:omega-amidase